MEPQEAKQQSIDLSSFQTCTRRELALPVSPDCLYSGKAQPAFLRVLNNSYQKSFNDLFPYRSLFTGLHKSVDSKNLATVFLGAGRFQTETIILKGIKSLFKIENVLVHDLDTKDSEKLKSNLESNFPGFSVKSVSGVIENVKFNRAALGENPVAVFMCGGTIGNLYDPISCVAQIRSQLHKGDLLIFDFASYYKSDPRLVSTNLNKDEMQWYREATKEYCKKHALDFAGLTFDFNAVVDAIGTKASYTFSNAKEGINIEAFRIYRIDTEKLRDQMSEIGFKLQSFCTAQGNENYKVGIFRAEDSARYMSADATQ